MFFNDFDTLQEFRMGGPKSSKIVEKPEKPDFSEVLTRFPVLFRKTWFFLGFCIVWMRNIAKTQEKTGFSVLQLC